MNNNDCIRLSFPINPAYVSSARLTVSSISNRIRLGVEETEDIKTAVSEACIYIIRRAVANVNSNFEICFMPGVGEISVEITAQDNKGLQSIDEEEMGLMMIRALVDEFTIIKPEEGKILITMVKRQKDNW